MRKFWKMPRMVLLACCLSGVLSLTACSALDFVKPGGLSVDAQVGKTNTQNEAVVSAYQDNTSAINAESIHGVQRVSQDEAGVQLGNFDGSQVSISNIPLSFLILMALGWILPGPLAILKGLGAGLVWIRDFIKGVI